MSEPLHPTYLDTTSWDETPSYVCGPDCPRPAGPDAARDARVAKRRAEDARAAGRALDVLCLDCEVCRPPHPCAGGRCPDPEAHAEGGHDV